MTFAGYSRVSQPYLIPWEAVGWPRKVWEAIALPPFFCQDGAQDVFKIDERIGGGGGGCSKSSEKFWKMIDQHQKQQAL